MDPMGIYIYILSIHNYMIVVRATHHHRGGVGWYTNLVFAPTHQIILIKSWEIGTPPCQAIL